MATELNPNPGLGVGPRSVRRIPNITLRHAWLSHSGEKRKQSGGVFVYHYCGFFASESASCSDPFRFAGAKIEEDKK